MIYHSSIHFSITGVVCIYEEQLFTRHDSLEKRIPVLFPMFFQFVFGLAPKNWVYERVVRLYRAGNWTGVAGIEFWGKKGIQNTWFTVEWCDSVPTHPKIRCLNVLLLSNQDEKGSFSSRLCETEGLFC